MFSRSPPKIFKGIIRSRSLTQATATLRTSPSVTQQLECHVEGTPDYSVILRRSDALALSGQDIGSQVVAKVDLIFYGGCHFACDKHPQTPRLTLSQEAALLFDRSEGTEMPAVLFYFGELEGSPIALKGTEGEETYEHTATGVKYFAKTLRDLK